ncbi:hypothetical protein T265_15523, partial [Opisthorchis viverrini]
MHVRLAPIVLWLDLRLAPTNSPSNTESQAAKRRSNPATDVLRRLRMLIFDGDSTMALAYNSESVFHVVSDGDDVRFKIGANLTASSRVGWQFSPSLNDAYLLSRRGMTPNRRLFSLFGFIHFKPPTNHFNGKSDRKMKPTDHNIKLHPTNNQDVHSGYFPATGGPGLEDQAFQLRRTMSQTFCRLFRVLELKCNMVFFATIDGVGITNAVPGFGIHCGPTNLDLSSLRMPCSPTYGSEEYSGNGFKVPSFFPPSRLAGLDGTNVGPIIIDLGNAAVPNFIVLGPPGARGSPSAQGFPSNASRVRHVEINGFRPFSLAIWSLICASY